MLALTILSIFILLILLLIFIEYRNEKKYQEKRRAEAQQKRRPRKKLKVKKVERKREPAPKPKPEPIPEAEHTPEPEIIPEPILEPELIAEPVAIPKPEVEIPQEIKQLPEANYPNFSHARLVDMGLSDEEAREFVTELIPQLEIQIPLIEEAMNIPDFHQMERLTHSIKGSATNLGTGGVSDLLVEWNTYLKTGTDTDITKAYFDHLVHYTAELKAQYT